MIKKFDKLSQRRLFDLKPGTRIKQYDSTKRYPQNTCCYIEFEAYDPWRDNVRPVGTGFLIAENIMITAAHNFLSSKLSKIKNHNIVISPHVHNALNPVHNLPIDFVSRHWIHPKYYDLDNDPSDPFSYNPYNDIAIVELTGFSRKQNYAKLRKFDQLPIKDINQSTIRVSGYNPMTRGKLAFGEGEFSGEFDSVISYHSNTVGGFSGGPITITHKGTTYVCGVHIGGYAQLEATFEPQTNKGVIFNNENIKWIQEKINHIQLEGSNV